MTLAKSAPRAPALDTVPDPGRAASASRRASLARAPEPDIRLLRGRVERLVGPGEASVRLARDDRRVRATLTLGATGCTAGDVALCALADDGAWYVLAVVRSPPAHVARGSQDAGSGDGGSPALRIHRPEGSTRSVVYLPPGAVDFVSDGDVTWTTRGAMHIEALGGVVLGAGQALDGAPGAAATRLRLDADRAELRAPRIEAAAEQVHVDARRATIAADVIDATAGVLRRTVELLETDAERILERAGSSYREVKDLAQTRAGRLRTLVEKTATTLADRFVLKTRADVRIDGERIHLG